MYFSPSDFVGTWRSIYYIEKGSYPSDYGYGYLYLTVEMTKSPSFRHKAEFKVYSKFNRKPDVFSRSGYDLVETVQATNRNEFFEGFAEKACWDEFNDREDFEYTLVSRKKLVRYNDLLGPEEFYRIQ